MPMETSLGNLKTRAARRTKNHLYHTAGVFRERILLVQAFCPNVCLRLPCKCDPRMFKIKQLHNKFYMEFKTLLNK